jgi:chromate transporter
VSAPAPTFAEAVRVWLFVGLNSFGGPAGQIAVLHRELVERRRWISESRFLHALDLCVLLPGPEAQQLAVYAGWLLHGVRGGLAAGILFVVPGALAMLALCVLYVGANDLAWFQGLFLGVKAAVVVVVAVAVARIAKRAIQSRAACVLAAVAFVAAVSFDVAVPAIVAAAIAAGLLFEAVAPGLLRPEAERGIAPEPALAPRPKLAQSARTAALGIAIWLAPVALVVVADPGGGIQAEMGRFFSGAAVVTFGGAYAALSYAAQHAAGAAGWLAPAQMADGLGLAESTPGPLILVLQFVAFVGAHQHPGAWSPLAAAVTASAVMLWTTFAPCFVWIFVLAPWMETVRASRRLSAALAAVSAAVVGVVLHLAMWFAIHVLFRETRTVERGGVDVELPAGNSVDVVAVAIAALAAVLLLRARWPLFAVLGTCALAGLAAQSTLQ